MKYLKGHPRGVNMFYVSIQDEGFNLTVCCDSDWPVASLEEVYLLEVSCFLQTCQ